MFSIKKLAFAVVTGLAALSSQAAGTRAEVIHWWTSGGESAAIKELAKAYTAAGGEWVDTAVAGGEQARSAAINRMVGNNAPTAAQFNTSKQFRDLIDEGMLNNIDEIASKQNWDAMLPKAIVDTIKVKDHYYAVPVNIHNPAWAWYSKDAFAKAGIAGEPKSIEELFAALDKARTLINPDERCALYREMNNRIVQEDAARVPLFSLDHAYDVQPRVKNFVVPWNGWSDMSYYKMEVE